MKELEVKFCNNSREFITNKMPVIPQAAAKDGEKVGINAILLGPPGAGKGTQVRHSVHSVTGFSRIVVQAKYSLQDTGLSVSSLTPPPPPPLIFWFVFLFLFCCFCYFYGEMYKNVLFNLIYSIILVNPN